MRHRHTLYLSEAMTQRLQLVAEAHRLSKSEILERALRRYLTLQNNNSLHDLINIQQEANARSLRRLERDLAIAVELIATFVRYFVTITPPLPEDAHEAARALGQLRFDQVVENVANRFKADRGLVARVMSMVEQGHPQELPANSRQPGEAHAASGDRRGPSPFNGRSRRQMTCLPMLRARRRKQRTRSFGVSRSFG